MFMVYPKNGCFLGNFRSLAYIDSLLLRSGSLEVVFCLHFTCGIRMGAKKKDQPSSLSHSNSLPSDLPTAYPHSLFLLM